VRPVVAAETSREIVVAKIIGMGAPGHLHLRENVTQVNVGNGFSRLLDELALSVVNIRICIAVEGDNALDDARSGRFAVRIIRLEEFDGFLPDIRQLCANGSL
jgi:hypothetical protein